MVNEAATGLPADHPMMKAWDTFRATFEFQNALHWAMATNYADGREISAATRELHAKGSLLWAAFTAGLAADDSLAQPSAFRSVPSISTDNTEAPTRWRHHRDCDVHELDPALQPGVKPCNCFLAEIDKLKERFSQCNYDLVASGERIAELEKELKDLAAELLRREQMLVDDAKRIETLNEMTPSDLRLIDLQVAVRPLLEQLRTRLKPGEVWKELDAAEAAMTGSGPEGK